MKEIITIQNLGPIQDVTLELKPFVMLIGESASGKSTILKTVRMMREAYRYVAVQSYLHHSGIVEAPFHLGIHNYLYDFGLMSLVTEDTKIEYKIIHGDAEYALSYKHDNQVPIAPVIRTEHLSYETYVFLSENRSFIPNMLAVATQGIDIQDKLFMETFSAFNIAASVLESVDLPYLNMRFKYNKSASNGDRYQIVPMDNHHDVIEYKYASSGIQTSTPLTVIARYLANHYSFKNDFNRSVIGNLIKDDQLTKFTPAAEVGEMRKVINMHIEEPELSLYPDAQRLLISHLVDIIKNANDDRDMQLMFATHSPYILNHVAYLLEASYYPEKAAERGLPELKPEDVQVYQVKDGKASSLMATTPEGHVTVNTMALSTTMSDIYNETKSLRDA